MTTTTDIPTPKMLEVKTGAVIIPTDLRNVGSFKDLSTIYREVNHLLSILPEDSFDTEEDEEDLIVITDNVGVLKYAFDKGYLCDFMTTINTLVDTYAGDVCNSCVDDIIETNLDRDFTVQLLENGNLYVVFSDKEAG